MSSKPFNLKLLLQNVTSGRATADQEWLEMIDKLRADDAKKQEILQRQITEEKQKLEKKKDVIWDDDDYPPEVKTLFFETKDPTETEKLLTIVYVINKLSELPTENIVEQGGRMEDEDTTASFSTGIFSPETESLARSSVKTKEIQRPQESKEKKREEKVLATRTRARYVSVSNKLKTDKTLLKKMKLLCDQPTGSRDGQACLNQANAMIDGIQFWSRKLNQELQRITPEDWLSIYFGELIQNI